jgi:hypothetical protein
MRCVRGAQLRIWTIPWLCVFGLWALLVFGLWSLLSLFIFGLGLGIATSCTPCSHSMPDLVALRRWAIAAALMALVTEVPILYKVFKKVFKKTGGINDVSHDDTLVALHALRGTCLVWDAYLVGDGSLEIGSCTLRTGRASPFASAGPLAAARTTRMSWPAAIAMCQGTTSSLFPVEPSSAHPQGPRRTKTCTSPTKAVAQNASALGSPSSSSSCRRKPHRSTHGRHTCRSPSGPRTTYIASVSTSVRSLP